MPPPGPDPTRVASTRTGAAERAGWLVLALDGPAADLPSLVTGTPVHVTPDPRRFRDLLLVERPRIVVVCEPPGGEADLDLVAAERRRRSRLRTLHLAPPEAVANRMAALARGFDDALTTATSGDELAARLAWLEARTRERHAPGTRLPIAEGWSWIRSPTTCAGGRPRSTSGPRSSACWPSWHPTRGVPTRATSSSSVSGGTGTTGAPGRSTSMSAGCGRRSSPIPIDPSTWSPCVVSATGSIPRRH